jgi:Lrp/AsnC family transcriptional regulator for asnA, asnC and gidA
VIKGEMAKDGENPFVSRRPVRNALDPVSKSIIEMLQVDGRRAYDSIAAELGISEDTVVQRVKQLIDSGIIQITAVSDPLQLGFARQAMLGIKVEPTLTKQVAQALAEISSVVYVVITAGDFDILVEVVGESDAHLLELVTARIRPIAGVVSIHTFLYLELEKQTYTWGVR